MELLNRPDIGDLLERHGITPSRALGQNFLCDPHMVTKIVRLAGVEPGDSVIEIGPGLGSLTLGLVKAGASVTAIELDKFLVPILREVVEGKDVTVIQADAMEVDWQPILGEKKWRVVANLPYNVAAPLVLDLLASQPQLVSWTVMVQKEVGERLAADPGSKTYGIPSVLRAYWGTAKVVGNVGHQVFLPRPRVDSALVRIERHAVPPVDVPFDELAKLVRAGFGQRRKMLRRSLSQYLTSAQIEASGVDPTARGETLDLDAWAALVRTNLAS
jgi:16S rRNA (adenine1518-N6/adenine1519-N6)-dimethyltransferase